MPRPKCIEGQKCMAGGHRSCNHWYVVRTDEFPYGYWSETIKNIKHWAPFYGEASIYMSREAAEEKAFRIAAENPYLIGVVDVLQR